MGSVGRGMIIPVGAQIEQIKFLLNKYVPKFVGLVGTDTDKSREELKNLVELLKENNIEHKQVVIADRVDEISILIEKLDELFMWLKSGKSLSEEEILIDITGGRKWMSSAMLLFAYLRGLMTVYVHVDYINVQGRSVVKKGSEKNIERDPRLLVRKLDDENAISKFKKGDFVGAMEIWKKIKSPNSNLKKTIAEFANRLFMFDLKGIGEQVEELRQDLLALRLYDIVDEFDVIYDNWLGILVDISAFVKNDKEMFIKLRDQEVVDALLTLFFWIKGYCDRRQDLNTKVLLIYRAIELVIQSELVKRGVPVYVVPEEIRDRYKSEYERISQKLSGSGYSIPERNVTLISGLILLLAMGWNALSVEDASRLKKEVEVRNKLWLEHGFQSNAIKKDNADGEDIKKMEERLLKLLVNLDKKWIARIKDREGRLNAFLERLITLPIT